MAATHRDDLDTSTNRIADHGADVSAHDAQHHATVIEGVRGWARPVEQSDSDPCDSVSSMGVGGEEDRPDLPRFLKRDLRAWAPGQAYAQADELRRAGEVTHAALIGCTLAGRVQGKNVLVHSSADGTMAGKCSICRAWPSPYLEPAFATASTLPAVDLSAEVPASKANGVAAAAMFGASKQSNASVRDQRPRAVSMCCHTIALLLHFLEEKQTIMAAAKPALFTQLQALGPERLIALVGIVAGRNPALLGRLQSYINMVTRPDAGLSGGIQRSREFLANNGFHDPSAPLLSCNGGENSNAAPTTHDRSLWQEGPPESIFQRSLAQALRQYAQESYYTGKVVQHRLDTYRTQVRPLLESRFREIQAVPAPDLDASEWSSGGNPLQQLVPLAGEIFAACRAAGISTWQQPRHADVELMIMQVEDFVVRRLLRWAWKPISSNEVRSRRPNTILTFEVTPAQRRAWLAAVERTPSTLLWPALARLHEPIHCGSSCRLAVDKVAKAIISCTSKRADDTRSFDRPLAAKQPVLRLQADAQECLPNLVDFQLDLLLSRQWQRYAEASGLCHSAGRPIDACMSLVEAAVRYHDAVALRDGDGDGDLDIDADLDLLDQVVQYVQQHQDAVRKQCKDSEEARVIALLLKLENVSTVHCVKACVAGDRYALAADCLMRSTRSNVDRQKLLAELLVSHPEMLRNPQDSARYIAALSQGAVVQHPKNQLGQQVPTKSEAQHSASCSSFDSSSGSGRTDLATHVLAVGDVVNVDRTMAVGEGGRATITSISSDRPDGHDMDDTVTYTVKYTNPGPCEKSLTAGALTLLEPKQPPMRSSALSDIGRSGTRVQQEQNQNHAQKPDPVVGNLLQVYAAAATGLSGHDDYWGGRGHIDQPAWRLVQQLASCSSARQLLDQNIDSVLQLFARTSLTQTQFRQKHIELKTKIYPKHRWNQLVLPRLAELCEAHFHSDQFYISRNSKHQPDNPKHGDPKSIRAKPKARGVNQPPAAGCEQEHNVAATPEVVIPSTAPLLSQQRWVEFLLYEGDVVAAMSVLAKQGDAEVHALRFDSAVRSFDEALALQHEAIPSDASLLCARSVEQSNTTLRDAIGVISVKLEQKRTAAAAAATGDYSKLSASERQHAVETERRIKEGINMAAAAAARAEAKAASKASTAKAAAAASTTKSALISRDEIKSISGTTKSVEALVAKHGTISSSAEAKRGTRRGRGRGRGRASRRLVTDKGDTKPSKRSKIIKSSNDNEPKQSVSGGGDGDKNSRALDRRQQQRQSERFGETYVSMPLLRVVDGRIVLDDRGASGTGRQLSIDPDEPIPLAPGNSSAAETKHQYEASTTTSPPTTPFSDTNEGGCNDADVVAVDSRQHSRASASNKRARAGVNPTEPVGSKRLRATAKRYDGDDGDATTSAGALLATSSSYDDPVCSSTGVTTNSSTGGMKVTNPRASSTKTLVHQQATTNLTSADKKDGDATHGATSAADSIVSATVGAVGICTIDRTPPVVEPSSPTSPHSLDG